MDEFDIKLEEIKRELRAVKVAVEKLRARDVQALRAAALCKERWDKTTPEERTAIMKKVSSYKRDYSKGGRKRDPNRCACGEMTLARAKARGHRCLEDGTLLPPNGTPAQIEARKKNVLQAQRVRQENVAFRKEYGSSKDA